MNYKIPLFKTYSDEDDVNAVTKIIKRGTFWADGPEISEFESKVADYIGVKYALAFNSGTSALHVMFLAYNIKNSEVIVPAFTFVATANAVVLAGGKPVFAETETDTFGLDVEDVRKRITSKTKAIVTIHYGGFPARDTEKLRALADEYNILFLEDAAQSFGASINNKMIGSFGDSSIFSFCQNKILPTGEGGMILTNSVDIYEKAKLLRSHGRIENEEDYFSTTKDNDYIEAGYNFRLPTMLAALGISQLNKVQKLIDMRRSAADYLISNLSVISDIFFMKKIDCAYQVFQMFTFKLSNKKIRDDLQEYLISNSIMCKIYFNPINLKTLYINNFNCKKGDLPITEDLADKVLTIPFYPGIERHELDYLIETIKAFFKTKE